jgi:hypothetical protein
MFVDLTAEKILIPTKIGFSVLPYMGHRDKVPEDFWKSRSTPRRDRNARIVVKDKNDLAYLVSEWFYSGLSFLSLQVKPNVVGDRNDFFAYFSTVMQSSEPSHEHKFAYLTYLLHQCCTDIEFEPRTKG